MRTRIYLVRHAEAQSNVNPLFKGEDTLSETGLKQAHLLAQRFKDIPINNIYTSNTLRAELTAQEIGKIKAVHPIGHDFLREQKGTFTPDLTFTSTEVYEDLIKRLTETQSFLETISDKHIVIVSHAIFLKSLLAKIMLGDLLTEDLLLKITNALSIDNTGVTKLMFNKEKSRWHIELLNDLIHLT